MADYQPIGWKNGQIQRLESGDTIDPAFVTSPNSASISLSTSLPSPLSAASNVQEALEAVAPLLGPATGIDSGKFYLYQDMRDGRAFGVNGISSTSLSGPTFSIFQVGSGSTPITGGYFSGGVAYIQNQNTGTNAYIGLVSRTTSIASAVTSYLRLRLVVSFFSPTTDANRFFGIGQSLNSVSYPLSSQSNVRSAYLFSTGNNNWRLRKLNNTNSLIVDTDTGIASSNSNVFFDLELYLNKTTSLVTFTIRNVTTKSVLWTGDVSCSDLTDFANANLMLRSETTTPASQTTPRLSLLSLEIEGQ